MSSNTLANDSAKLPFLDGLRGLLALWVFWGHLSSFCGLRIPGLSAPGSAVDAFMLLSGFLMVHATRRTLGTTVAWPHVWRFYAGRWFRIAPLYYALLLISAAVAGSLTLMEMEWLSVVHGGPAQASAHVPDKSGVATWPAVLLHASFLFGLFPQWATSTPMPDWSLSLEMQFYLLFPLLCLLDLRRWHVLLPLVAVSVGLGLAAPHWLGHYAQPGTWLHFRQPSLIVFKLQVFVAGMLLAHSLGQGDTSREALMRLALALLCLLPSRPVVWVFFGLFAWLLYRPQGLAARWLSTRPLRILGDWSYCVYLCHFLLMAPMLWWLQAQWQVAEMPAWHRYGIALPACSAVVFLTAFVLHHWVERPFIAWGKRLTTRRSSADRLQTSP